ncbi:MAG: TIGR03757 family integrating conjugative element protein [Azoarcus sp.]|jgi:integrating conjugative element protein (TIGR03757 family)|nr:TIGR03757 family integrating conjugative element protein [Azoarcus sp.]
MSHRLLFFVFTCAFAAHVQAADIRVYTDHSITLQYTKGAQIVFLDAPRRLEQDLSAALPADPKHAEAMARKRLQTGANLQRALANAWQGVTDAWARKITHLPAVVVDGRYVVYGEPDVAKAAARIAAFRSHKP